jgi:PAS domain-containing protein
MEVMNTWLTQELKISMDHKEGRRYYIAVAFPLKDDVGKIIGVCAITTEIIERKRIEEDLRKNRRFLADLIDNSAAIICTKDRYGRYELVNRQWKEVPDMELMLHFLKYSSMDQNRFSNYTKNTIVSEKVNLL